MMVHISPSVLVSALILLRGCLGIPLTSGADCDEETGPIPGGGTTVMTVSTTVTATTSAASSSFPSDTSKTGLCQGSLKRHESLVLWEGMPNRTDTAGNNFANWPWLEEVASATNALLGLVRVEKESGTNAQIDILADEYIPEVIFGASEDMYTRDPHAFADPEAAKSGKYRPRLRVNTDGKGAVSLNLFPMSEKGVLRVCVTFDLTTKEGDGPIWWQAIHAAFDHEEVKLRLKDNAWYPETFVSKNQFTTMAMLEMLTGYKTEYIYRNWNNGGYPQVEPSGKGNSMEYEQDRSQDSNYPAFQDWMLGPGEHTKPTPNWNPTVMFSMDTAVRALKPVPDQPPGESFKNVFLQDSRASMWPYDKQVNGNDNYDRKMSYGDVWAGHGKAMIWIARLKIDFNNMAPLSAAPKAVGDAIGKSGYFKLDDSITGGS